MTDALKAAVTNTMRHAVPGVGMVEDGVSIKNRWIELRSQTPEEDARKEDARPASEIAAEIWAHIRGEESGRI